MTKLEAEIEYYNGYARGLEYARSQDAQQVRKEIDHAKAVLEHLEKGSALGYFRVGRIEGMRHALKLKVQDRA
jgi:hypothetical protein